MADQVGQLEGAHAEAAGVAHQCVEGGAVGGAFLQQAQAFGIEGARHAVDDEARSGLRVYRLLAPGLGGFVQAFGQGAVAGQARYDLYQGHQRRRVEEVHADHPAGMLEAGSQAGDGQGRGIAGEDAVGAAQLFELAQQATLDLQVLDDGFDHQAGIGQGLDGLHRLQAGDDGGAGFGGEFVLLHQAAELAVDAVDGLGGRAGAVVIELDRMAGLGGDLSDAGTHGAGADHGDGGGSVEGGHGLSVL
ncbi:hypothetical protein D9M69_530480 [compost metagenome]